MDSANYHTTETTQPENSARWNSMRKAAALLEVLGILVGGNFTANLLVSWMGVTPLNAILRMALEAKEPDFIALSVGWVQVLCVQYTCLLLPALAVGWWRRRPGLAYYGLTTAGQSVWRLSLLAFGAFAFVALPLKLLWLLKQHVPLGPEPATWALLNQGSSIAFWVFLAISSFALAPVLEELFFRSYCQTRLEEDFGGAGAVVIVAFMMTLGSGSYQSSWLSFGAIVTTIPIALGTGYVFWRSRSLVPAVMLHVLANFPARGTAALYLPAVMILLIGILMLFRMRWLASIRRIHSEWTAKGWKASVLPAAVVAILVVLAFQRWPAAVIAVALPGFVIALVLDLRERELADTAPQFET